MYSALSAVLPAVSVVDLAGNKPCVFTGSASSVTRSSIPKGNRVTAFTLKQSFCLNCKLKHNLKLHRYCDNMKAQIPHIFLYFTKLTYINYIN